MEGILRLRGGKEICSQALALSQNILAKESVKHLSQVWDALEDYGVAKHVMIDLTMIGDFSYYTGMTFEGYAAELGFPVCSGGRYDNLLQQFGRPAPATGFSLKTNRILDGVNGIEVDSALPILVQYDVAHRKIAFAEAKRLRGEGRSVVMKHCDGPFDLVSDAVGQDSRKGPLGPAYGEIISFVGGD